MNTNHPVRSGSLCAALVTLTLCGNFWLATGLAAEPEFVGVLAIAVEDDVAKVLGLTDQQKSDLFGVIDRREDSAEALELALELKDLSLEEREKRLAPFRQESERQGLAVLTTEQVKLLQEIVSRRPDAARPDKPVAPAENASAAAAASNVDGASANGVPPSTSTDPNVTGPPDPARTAQWPRGPFYVPADKPGEAGDSADAAVDPAAPPADAVPDDTASDKPVTMEFNFHHQPWKTVVEWFAERAGLSLVTDTYPQGTLNYIDDRAYTPAEALDVINSVLLTRGYTLVRKQKALMLINLDDGIPPNLIEYIPAEELDERSEYELVGVLFNLNRMTAEEAETEINKLIGPQGSVVPLPKSRQIMVTETAGRLRAIRSVIMRVEDPLALGEGELQAFNLEFALAEDAMAILRQLLDIPAEGTATADGSLRFAMDPFGDRLLATGKPEKLAEVEKILKVIDVPGPGQVVEDGVAGSPQLQVYTVTAADPEAVLAVMQTLLAGLPEVRLTIDPKTGNLVALARPAQHETIRSTLDALQRDARQIDVIQLYTVDAQVAVLAINRLFGVDDEDASANAPQVDADPISQQLLIRATPPQIEQIRSLLEKMGEDFSEKGRQIGTGKWRMVPLSGRAARSALEQVQEMWPAMRRNQIRVVTPSAVIPSMRPGSLNDRERPEVPVPGAEPPKATPPVVEPPSPPAAPASPKSPSGDNPATLSAGAFRDVRVSFASWTIAQAPSEEPIAVPPAAPVAVPPAAPNWDVAEDPVSADPAQPAEAKEPPTIIVAIQAGGLMIACEDTEALDEFEDLLNFFAGNTMAGGSDITIFYLKHTKATVAAEILDQVFGGGTLSSGDAGGGGLMGDLANAALGDAGGGLLGSLMGLGGGGGTITPSGTLRITPDTRLNALIVQANPIDSEMIEQLLEIIDREGPPDEILAVPRAKLVPVVNTQADEIATILQDVYRDRMTSGSTGGGQGGRPSPQDIMQIIRGGGGRSRGGSQGATEQIQKMSMSVDTRTNSLIVAAPEPLLTEVIDLIAQLDQAALQNPTEVTRVIKLRRVGSDAVQQALSVLTGASIRTRRPSSGTTGGRPTTSGSPAPSGYRPPTMPFRPPTSSYRPPSSTSRPSSGTSRPSSGTSRPSSGFSRPGGSTPSSRPGSRPPSSFQRGR